MRTIKFLSVLVLSLLMTSAFAQGGQGQRVQRTPEQTAQAQVDWMTKDLSLDQAAAKKVYDCVLKFTKQSTAEMQKLGQDATREARTAKRTEITAAQDKELKTILGDSKFELYKKKQAERRAAAQQQRQN
jgi:hypothetical protein